MSILLFLYVTAVITAVNCVADTNTVKAQGKHTCFIQKTFSLKILTNHSHHVLSTTNTRFTDCKRYCLFFHYDTHHLSTYSTRHVTLRLTAHALQIQTIRVLLKIENWIIAVLPTIYSINFSVNLFALSTTLLLIIVIFKKT